MPEPIEPTEPVTPEPQAGTEPTEPVVTPPWGDDFDPEKAWKLVQGLRADKERLAGRPVLDDDAKRKLTEYDRLVEASRTDLERKTEEATRWQTEAEKWRTNSVSSRIEALAATDFADPSDAAGQLDPAKYLDSGGQIDDAAIKADLAEVLERKPHWRRQKETAPPRVPAPNANQGSGTGGKPVSDPRQEFAAILQSGLSRS